MSSPLAEVAALFFRLGCTAFGGPAAHVALIERECVARRGWITRQQFLDLLGVANLIPGPTSTELAMHVGRQRAGWPGLVAAGLAFILPGAVLVGVLAAIYQRAGQLPVARGVADAVQPVVVVLVLQALVPLGQNAIRSVPMVMVAIAVALMAVAGIPEIRILLFAGVAHLIVGRTARPRVAAFLLMAPAAVAAPEAFTAEAVNEIGASGGVIVAGLLQESTVGDVFSPVTVTVAWQAPDCSPSKAKSVTCVSPIGYGPDGSWLSSSGWPSGSNEPSSIEALAPHWPGEAATSTSWQSAIGGWLFDGGVTATWRTLKFQPVGRSGDDASVPSLTSKPSRRGPLSGASEMRLPMM